jgi:hypothetical protein
MHLTSLIKKIGMINQLILNTMNKLKRINGINKKGKRRSNRIACTQYAKEMIISLAEYRCSALTIPRGAQLEYRS